MRRPRRLILDNHEPTERCEVFTNGVIRQRSFRSPNVLGQSSCCSVGGDVASEASEQLPDLRWIMASAVNTSDIDATNLVEVIADGAQRLCDRQMAESGPPAYRDLVRQVSDRQSRIGASLLLSGQELGERNCSIASTDLEEGHGTHAKSSYPSSTRVPRDVVCGNSGSSEDELARLSPIINGTTDVVSGLDPKHFTPRPTGGTSLLE